MYFLYLLKMRIWNLLWIVLIIGVNPTFSCLAKYAPDADKVADDIYPSAGIDKSLNCGTTKCGKGYPGSPDQASLWHAEINSTFAPPCFGSLINDRLILTSSSCIINFNHATIKSMLQSKKINPTEFIVRVPSLSANPVGIKSVECHPRAVGIYVITGEIDYDICLLEMKDPISFSSSGLLPVCLPPLDSGWELQDRVGRNHKGTEVNIFHVIDSLKDENPRRFCSQLRLKGETPQQGRAFNNALMTFPNVGSPLMLESKTNQVLVGVLSHKNFGLNKVTIDATPVDVHANIVSEELLSFIHKVSEELGAKYCKLPVKVAIPVNKGNRKYLKTIKQGSRPWDTVTSSYRREKFSCKCGLKLADADMELDAKGKIIGGEDANIDHFVWQAQLIMINRELDTVEQCGAAIINSKMLLSAAHCVFQHGNVSSPADIEVLLRAKHGFASFEQTHPKTLVKKIWVPSEFTPFGNLPADIALLELEIPLKFTQKTKIYPVCLPTTNEFKLETEVPGETGIGKLIGKPATVIGYGSINEERDNSATLQRVDAIIRSRSVCDTKGIFKPPDDGIICAGNLKDKEDYMDPFHGDSGGPLMIPLTMAGSKGKQQMVEVGVVSAGDFEYNHDKPILWYTSTPYYLPWIDFLSYRAGAIWCNRPQTIED